MYNITDWKKAVQAIVGDRDANYEHALKMISESIVREIDEEIKKHEFKFERFIPSTPDHDYNHSPATLHTLPMNGLSL